MLARQQPHTVVEEVVRYILLKVRLGFFVHQYIYQILNLGGSIDIIERRLTCLIRKSSAVVIAKVSHSNPKSHSVFVIVFCKYLQR